MIDCRRRANGLLVESGRRWRCVRVERRADIAAARPEARADHFMRIRFAGDGISAWALRRAPSAKSGDSQIETAPIKMHWTALADEARAEFLEYDFGRNQNA